VSGVLDDHTDRDVIALAEELVAPEGKLTALHLHLVTAKPARDSGSLADMAQCRTALERLTALANELSVDAELRCVEAHSPRRGLHEFASRRRADLLVVGASRGDENDRTFLGDDTRKVLEDAPCAVAVAPPEFAARAGAIKTIGVSFDGSVHSERAVALARRPAAERCAELSAFEAVPVPVYARDPWNVKGEVEEHVEAARQRVAAPGHLEPEAGAGDPVHELARYGQSVDLLVIGGHDYRPIDHLLEQAPRSGWPMRSRRRCSCFRLQRRHDAGEELSSSHAHRLHPGRMGRRGVGHLRTDAGRPGRRAGCRVRSDTRGNGRRACLLLDWQRLRRLPGGARLLRRAVSAAASRGAGRGAQHGGRPGDHRPRQAPGGAPAAPLHHPDLVTGHSFPSGHTGQTAALCAVLVIEGFMLRGARPLLVARVAFSRVYLGVHYPSDVVAGAVLGPSWSAVASRQSHLWNSADDRSEISVGPQGAAWAR
jgi:nucleotide-binding universal stress UspA family protein